MNKISRAYSREEVERIISILENVEKKGIDPFTVDVRELLLKLKKMLEENPSLEYYTLDAEVLYKIATIIALQNKWLTDKARSLFIDSQLISSRLAALDKKSIVQAFLKVWSPIISLGQLTPQRIQHGIDHFLSLPPRREEKTFGWKLTDKEAELSRIALEKEKEEMEEKMKKLFQELVEEARKVGEVDYWRFILRQSLEETYDRAYTLSFLITEGYVEVKRNPLKNEIRLIPNDNKVSRKNVMSLVISLGGSK
ncbi:MAG: hypothetical protein NZ929_06490 [Aigarchaeota archaeon]|nr:hypothetical protein [Aigarchaeota archaeon]MCX8192413.1 hypothetical protein [Nitrososphaeria archaeon]MDW7986619.1 hypothetical protein [Nitrososphaerota archaeon]